jgi:hypothetical protein
MAYDSYTDRVISSWDFSSQMALWRERALHQAQRAEYYKQDAGHGWHHDESRTLTMGQIDNLNQGQLPDILRRLRTLETASPLNNAAIGRGGLLVYGGGGITIENEGGLKVTGTAEIIGKLIATGIIDFRGEVNISGPLVVEDGGSVTIGSIEFQPDGSAKFGTLTIDPTGKITTGSAEIKPDGSAKFGKFTIAANGDLTSAGTMKIDGATTLNNTLTVASGKKVVVGGLTLENTGTGGGQVNFPGGSITASSALGMLINHATVEIAGTTVKISSLPTTTQPANIYADSNGRLYRSTAA